MAEKTKYFLMHPEGYETFDTLVGAEKRYNQLITDTPSHAATDPNDIMIVKGYELKTKHTILDT